MTGDKPKPPPPRTHLLGWRPGQHEPTPFEKSLPATPVKQHLSALHSLVEWATTPGSNAAMVADQHLREIAAVTRIHPTFADRPVQDYPELMQHWVNTALNEGRDALDRAHAVMMAHPEIGQGLLVTEEYESTEDSNHYTMTCTTTFQLSPDVPFGRIAYKRV